MKTTRQIEITTISGKTETHTEIRTDERKGRKLGTAIAENDTITIEDTDHVEREDDETMTFDFGTIRKDRIKTLISVNDGFGATIRQVEFAR